MLRYKANKQQPPPLAFSIHKLRLLKRPHPLILGLKSYKANSLDSFEADKLSLSHAQKPKCQTNGSIKNLIQ